MVLGLVGAEDAQLQRAADGRADCGMIVAEQRRAVRRAHIHVLAAVQIVDVWAFAARHEERMADGRVAAGRRAHTSRQVAAGKTVQLLGGFHGFHPF
jgi:hypothetical protein